MDTTKSMRIEIFRVKKASFGESMDSLRGGNEQPHRKLMNLLDKNICHRRGQIVPLNIDKRTDNTEPRSICFLPQYAELKKIFILAHDQDNGTKKQQGLSITLSQSDWFIS